MEGIRMIGMSICVTAAVTSLFSMLIPATKLDRVLKFAVSLFFLTSLVAPFVSGGLDFQVDFELPAASRVDMGLESAVQAQFTGLAERRVSAAVEKLLLKEGFAPQKIETEIHISGDGGVSINQIRIIPGAREAGNGGRIREIVEREVGLTPEILAP